MDGLVKKYSKQVEEMQEQKNKQEKKKEKLKMVRVLNHWILNFVQPFLQLIDTDTFALNTTLTISCKTAAVVRMQTKHSSTSVHQSLKHPKY